MALQIRRGLEADRLSITPVAGELLFVTDTNILYAGDGSTAGGVAVLPGSAAHGNLTGLLANDHPQYATTGTVITVSGDFATHTGDSTIHFTEGSIDHGTIAGLSDNDHPQYRTTASTISFSADMAQEGATTGDAPRWDGANWIASAITEGGGSSTISGSTDVELPNTDPQDGDTLTYCAASQTWMSSPGMPYLYGSNWHEDDFIAFNAEDGEIGELGWYDNSLQSQPSADFLLTDVLKHPGIFYCRGTSAISWRSLTLGQTAGIRHGMLSEFICIAGGAGSGWSNLTGATSADTCDVRIGLGNGGSHTSSFIGFVYAGINVGNFWSVSGTNWAAVASSGASTLAMTMIDTGIPATNTDWLKFHCKTNWDDDPITFEYFIDDVLVATMTSGTSQMPGDLRSNAIPIVSVKGLNGNGVAVDYYAYRARGQRR